MKTPIFMAATLAVATVAVLTSSPAALGSAVVLDQSQEGPCGIGTGNGPNGNLESRFDCEFNGHIEVEESGRQICPVLARC
jgi:hypothetical protein